MTAPKVSEEQIHAAIEKEDYVVLPDGKTTLCILYFFNNRFTVRGESACVAKENFNKELREQYAKKDAIDKCWQLFGFLLARDLAAVDLLGANAISGGVFVGTKAIYAKSMSRGEYNEYRGWNIPSNESPNECGMLVQYQDGYISWSPITTFNEAYRNIDGTIAVTFLERMHLEYEALGKNLKKCQAFTRSPKFLELGSRSQKWLREQEDHMEGYHYALGKRMEYIGS